MPRLLDNWLYSFRDWTLDRSEAPESLIIWSGLFTIASVVRRRVYFPRSIMGSYDIYPSLYVVFVGPPGVVRKSTTSAYSEELLNEIDHIKIASTAVSASKLIEMMSETIDGSIVVISSEFGSFMNVSKEEMYDLLTDIYDGKRKYEYATRAHGVEVTENPCVNMLAATTPKWISNQMPEYVLGGGFASRTIFVFEDAVRARRLYYNIKWSEYERLKESLIHDLHYMTDVSGEFRHDCKETKEWVEGWYRSSADEEVDERLEGYRNRRHVHLHKVAMLLSLAERDDKVVTKVHFEAALRILSGIEKNLPRVFSSIGRSPFSADIEAIRLYIQSSDKPVEYNQILSRFYQNVTEPDLKQIISTLVIMGDIDRIVNPDGREGVVAYKGRPLF